MTTIQISIDQLTTHLGALYGCEKTANLVAEPKDIPSPKAIATYNDMDGHFRFAIECELPLAVSLGAALTMIPPGGAEDAIHSGSVPENIGDNLYEVLNICAAVFADVEHHRIVLDHLWLPGNELPEGLSEKLSAAEVLIQVQFELERYPAGLVTLLQVV